MSGSDESPVIRASMFATKKSSMSHIRRTPSYGDSSLRLFVKVLRVPDPAMDPGVSTML